MMGRKKKIVEVASEEAIAFIMDAIHRYPQIRESCIATERQRPALLQRVSIKPDAFLPEAEPSEDIFVLPLLSGKDGAVVDEYLENKEKQYLLERGILGLDEDQRELAEAMFFERQTRAEIEQNYLLSQSTITRKRNEMIRQLAVEVDAFMNWKAEMLFG